MFKTRSFKKLVLLLMVVCMVFALGAALLVACNPDSEQNGPTPEGPKPGDEHTHVWATEWTEGETTHWHACTVAGCTEKNGEEPHVYTDDSDTTCDKCGHVRTIEHTHVWDVEWTEGETTHWHACSGCTEKSDEEPHVYTDEFDETCDKCGHVREIEHQHTYKYVVDRNQHWQESTCAEHDPVTTQKYNHFYTDGVCQCGMHQNYGEMYDLYSANQTYLGEEAIPFVEWFVSDDVQEADHIAKNERGDVVFYPAEGDENGVAKYFAERTVTVKAQESGAAIADVWFVLKVKVNGEYVTRDGKQVIASGKTGADGAVQLTFTPAWGYSEAEKVEYLVEVAKADELEGGAQPLPTRHEIAEASKSATVDDVEMQEVSFDVVSYLGVGEKGRLPERSITSVRTTYMLDESVEPGWYQLTIDLSQGNLKRAGDIYVSVDKGETRMEAYVVEVDKQGVVIFNIKEDTESITIDPSTSGTKINVKLESVDTKLENGKWHLVRSNANDVDDKLAYDISELSSASGMYVFMGEVETGDGSTRYIIDSGSEQVYSNEGLYDSKKAEVNTITFTRSRNRSTNASKTFYFMFKAVPVEEVEETTFQAAFTEDVSTVAYVYKPTDVEYPREFIMSATEAFANVSAKMIVRTGESVASARTLIAAGEQAATEYKSENFTVVENGEYIVFLDNGAKTALSGVKGEFKELTPETLPVGTEFDVTFTESVSTQTYFLDLEPGAYILLLNGGDLNGLTMVDNQSAHKVNINVQTSVEHYSDMIIINSTTGAVHYVITAKHEGAANYKGMLIKMEENAENSTTLKTEKTVAFGDKKYTTVAVSGGFVNNRSYGFTASSESSLSDVTAYSLMYGSLESADVYSEICQSKDSAAVFNDKLMYGTKSGRMTSYTTSGKIVVVFVNEGTTAPESITFKMQELFTNSASGVFNIAGNGQSVDGVKITTGIQSSSERFELYEAITDTEDDVPTYKLVKTFGMNEPFNYANNERLEAGYYRYIAVAYPTNSEVYMPRISDVYGFEVGARQLYTVKVDVPDFLEGYFPLIFRNRTSIILEVFQKVEKGTTQLTCQVALVEPYSDVSVKIPTNSQYSLETSSAFPFVRDVLSMIKYSDTEVKFTDSREVTLTTTANDLITVTVNVPENSYDGTTLYITIWKAGKTQSSFSAAYTVRELTVEHGVTQYTLLFPSSASGTDYTVEVVGEKNKGSSSEKKATTTDIPGLAYDTATVTFSEGNVGTATLTIKDRVAVKLSITLPDNFYQTELAAAPELSKSFSFDVKSGGTSVLTTAQKTVRFDWSAIQGNKFEFTIPDAYVAKGAEYDWTITNGATSISADGYEFVANSGKFNTAEATEIALEISQRILITVTVDVDQANFTKADNNLILDLYAKNEAGTEDGAAIKSVTVANTVLNQFRVEQASNSVVVAFPATKKSEYGYILKAKSKTSNPTDYGLIEASEVQMNGDTGTASVKYWKNASLEIVLTVPADFPSTTYKEHTTYQSTLLRMSFEVYKDDTKLNISGTTYISVSSAGAKTKNVVITGNYYDTNATYKVKFIDMYLDARYTADEATFKFEEGNRTASVSSTIKKADESTYSVITITLNLGEKTDGNKSITWALKDGETEKASLKIMVEKETTGTVTLKMAVAELQEGWTLTATLTGYNFEVGVLTVDTAQRTGTCTATMTKAAA